MRMQLAAYEPLLKTSVWVNVTSPKILQIYSLYIRLAVLISLAP